MAEKGLVMVDSRKASKEIAEFIAYLKEKGRKGKIRKVHGRWEFFSLFATMNTDYHVGYQVLLVDVGELGAAEDDKGEQPTWAERRRLEMQKLGRELGGRSMLRE